jgi:hypothetical protein
MWQKIGANEKMKFGVSHSSQWGFLEIKIFSNRKIHKFIKILARGTPSCIRRTWRNKTRSNETRPKVRHIGDTKKVFSSWYKAN